MSPERTALITGGATGIGRGIAAAFVAAGFRVAVTTHDTASSLLQPDGTPVASEQVDVTDSDAVTGAVNRLAEALGGRIDVLVNNAGGLIERRRIDDMTDDLWHSIVDLNLSSVLYVTRATLPFMAASGRIITVSSLAAHNGGGTGAVAYATAKGGVESFTRAAAKELGPRGISVTAIAPGFIIDTPFHERFTPKADQNATIAAIPLGRPGHPDDVAEAALFLAAENAAFASGTVIAVNGAAGFH